MRREMAVLRLMSHPGVARLIASFRWRDGAYLVLEFASKGDLFSQIAAQVPCPLFPPLACTVRELVLVVRHASASAWDVLYARRQRNPVDKFDGSVVSL